MLVSPQKPVNKAFRREISMIQEQERQEAKVRD